MHWILILVLFLDYICEEHNNPSDFFLDVLSGTIQPATVNNKGRQQLLSLDLPTALSLGEFVLLPARNAGLMFDRKSDFAETPWNRT